MSGNRARQVENEDDGEQIVENPVSSKYTIDQILDKASDFMEMYNYEMAQKFCQRALEMDNDDVRALELTASLLLEVTLVVAGKFQLDFSNNWILGLNQSAII